MLLRVRKPRVMRTRMEVAFAGLVDENRNSDTPSSSRAELPAGMPRDAILSDRRTSGRPAVATRTIFFPLLCRGSATKLVVESVDRAATFHSCIIYVWERSPRGIIDYRSSDLVSGFRQIPSASN